MENIATPPTSHPPPRHYRCEREKKRQSFLRLSIPTKIHHEPWLVEFQHHVGEELLIRRSEDFVERFLQTTTSAPAMLLRNRERTVAERCVLRWKLADEDENASSFSPEGGNARGKTSRCRDFLKRAWCRAFVNAAV